MALSLTPCYLPGNQGINPLKCEPLPSSFSCHPCGFPHAFSITRFYGPPGKRYPWHRKERPAQAGRSSPRPVPGNLVGATAAPAWTPSSRDAPVVGHGQGDLELGQELEVLLFRLLREAGPNQQHPEVLRPDHPVLGHRAGAFDIEDSVQAFRQPDGVQEVEIPQATAGVREVKQGASFYEEANGCPGRRWDRVVSEPGQKGLWGDALPWGPGTQILPRKQSTLPPTQALQTDGRPHYVGCCSTQQNLLTPTNVLI